MSDGEVRTWIPWDPDTGHSTSPRLATRWAEEESRRSGRRGLLVTDRKNGIYPEEIQAFGQRHAHTTHRSGGRSSGGPVILWEPNEVDLDDHGASTVVCAVEWLGFEVGGWAAYHGAVDLRTGEPAQMDDSTRKDIEFLAFQGHNAFTGDTDKLLVRATLAEMDGALSVGFICSAAMATGNVSRIGYPTLRKLVAADREGRPAGRAREI
jgi:hypothetical protein